VSARNGVEERLVARHPRIAARTDAEAAWSAPTRVLLAGLRPSERASVMESLELVGYGVEVVEDPAATLARTRAWRPHLLIVDLQPGIDGYKLLRTLREEGHDMPVLILSARGEESDKVLGFRLGADAYVTAPCGVLELLARVEALLRRRRDPEPARGLPPLRVGALEIDPAAHTVRLDGRAIDLRPKVFELLLALARHRGAAVSRRELLRDVWAQEEGVATRTVDMHVAELRRKLGDDPDHPRMVITVRKTGYRLAVDD
jgi:two-component system, OmpR family, alkaline phosphatase synthesis response regulator PhoP